MLRKSVVLVVVVYLLVALSSALFIHSLSAQSIAEQGEDRLGFSLSGRGGSGATPAFSTIGPQSQPPENWTLLGVDPDEGVGTSLKAVYTQVDSDILYFKVEHYRNWTTLDNLFDVVWLDTDQNLGTGMSFPFPGQCTCIGTDYLVIVNADFNAMYSWDPDSANFDFDNPIALAYLDAPEDASVMVVGVYLSDLENPALFDCVVSEGASWQDFAPDYGSFTFPAPAYGDINADDIVNLGDVVYLISYLYKGGPEPNCDGPSGVNTIPSPGQPPDDWILLGNDPDEGIGLGLKAVYAQIHSGVLYFKVEHYRSWTTPDDLADHIWIDADRNSGTGENEMWGMVTCTGIDYVIMIASGFIQTMLRWNPSIPGFDMSNPIPLAFLDLPTTGNTFVVGVHLSNLQNPGALDCAATNGESYDDFAPDCGHYTFPPCPCGDVNADRIVNIGDVVYLISYLYKGGPPPQCE